MEKLESRKPTVSGPIRRIAILILVFCLLNYFVRLVPLSVMEPLGWYPETEISNTEGFPQVVAWAEFSLVSAFILIVTTALMIFVFLREAFWFITRGRSACIVKPKPFLAVSVLLFFLCLFLFAMIPSGPDAFAGTRGAGLGLPFIMFIIAGNMAMVVPAAFLFAFDPRGMQAGFDRGERNRNGAISD